LTLAEKGYPKKLAFQYLEELAGEFNRMYGSQVDSVTRPYAFIKFGEMHVQTDMLVARVSPKCSWCAQAALFLLCNGSIATARITSVCAVGSTQCRMGVCSCSSRLGTKHMPSSAVNAMHMNCHISNVNISACQQAATVDTKYSTLMQVEHVATVFGVTD
jgi:hypothetical protein